MRVVSRLLDIKTGFLQVDSYAAIGFCLTEVPIAELIKKGKGYQIGINEQGELVSRTHSFIIDDLKLYAGSRLELETMNEIIVTASSDTGALYGVNKCVEIEVRYGKMVKGCGLEVLEERMKSLDPEKNECYRFLG